MLRILNSHVYNLKEAIIASGYAMRTELPEINDEEFNKGLVRMQKLVNASANRVVKCHHHALSGVLVSFDVIYPNYISPEMQRYHWFEITTSSSKMHRLLKMDFDKCCNKYVTKESKDLMKQYIDEYNKLANELSGSKEFQEILYQAWMKVLSNCPQGVELFMHVTTNYLQLQTIYFQRRHHGLREDWGAFCEWIESLPYFKELILGNNE